MDTNKNLQFKAASSKDITSPKSSHSGQRVPKMKRKNKASVAQSASASDKKIPERSTSKNKKTKTKIGEKFARRDKDNNIKFG